MSSRIAAIVPAAGLSRRMGRPKLVLPWGSSTVIDQVVRTLRAGGVEEVIVVVPARDPCTGVRDMIENALAGVPVRLAENPVPAASDMLDSLQIGIRAISPQVEALLVALGDQPSLDAASVRAVIEAHRGTMAQLVVPSYQLRRGHPWLAARPLWQELLSLEQGKTLRDFLNAHAGEIHYVPVDSPGVLKDLDTPEDYEAQKPV